MFPPETRVLIVDSHKPMRKLVSKTLGQFGLTKVAEIDNGANAWQLIEEAANKGTPFGLVTADWNLNEISGIDLLKKMRANESTKNIPFLMITAEAAQANVMEAVQNGASNYLVKPFSPATFSEKLNAAYKKHFPNKPEEPSKQ